MLPGLSRAVAHVYRHGLTSDRVRVADAKAVGKITTNLAEYFATRISQSTDPGLEVRAFNRLMDDLVTGQRRRERVLRLTVESQEHFTKNRLPSQCATISEDFLCQFWEMVDKTGNEEVQNILSLMLSRNICQPGAISNKTLIVLAGLDSRTLEKFGHFCSMSMQVGEQVFVLWAVCDQKEPTRKIHHVATGNYIGQEFEDYGITRLDMEDMRSSQLIGSGPHDFFVNLKEYATRSDISYVQRPVTLSCADDIVKDSHHAKAVNVTRAGVEIRSAMTLRPHPEYTTKLLEILAAGGFYLNIEPDDNIT